MLNITRASISGSFFLTSSLSSSFLSFHLALSISVFSFLVHHNSTNLPFEFCRVRVERPDVATQVSDLATHRLIIFLVLSLFPAAYCLRTSISAFPHNTDSIIGTQNATHFAYRVY